MVVQSIVPPAGRPSKGASGPPPSLPRTGLCRQSRRSRADTPTAPPGNRLRGAPQGWAATYVDLTPQFASE